MEDGCLICGAPHTDLAWGILYGKAKTKSHGEFYRRHTRIHTRIIHRSFNLSGA